MHRLTTFLRDKFAAAARPSLAATCSEMTLHDALRICGGGGADEACAPSTRAAERQIEVCRYHSEADLRAHLRRLDQPARRLTHLTVILSLESSLQGNLRESIQRRSLAHRLVIVPHAGHWPGVDSYGDLALASNALGWSLIELCRDFGDALLNAISAVGENERLLVVLPASRSTCRTGITA